MKKGLVALSVSALLVTGLVGCGANDNNNNVGTQNVDNPRMLRQNTNDYNARPLQNGNTYEIDDHEGPLTEMMDPDGDNRNNTNRIMDNNNQDRFNNNRSGTLRHR
ncbi:hypothetical protein [Bacillus sp. PS06]|uniref:hypothetical protein n=1 Tax=Bacillus sp. PS06 TaxID=2764176 RepID=UPI0017811785|nr:hypothetical protein [Bacillus sp. PS06]MBD8071522.1 hypothetical protein [Bacillus sp. PS06]